jgi:hypothetical protein
MAQLAIGRAVGSTMRCCGREPTIKEILSDSIVQAMMEADGIDPEVLEAQLQRMALEISAVRLLSDDMKNSYNRLQIPEPNGIGSARLTCG